jgi:para-aminobenzoate synthetase/4-amino-4-deoxychorismate lyase
MTLLPSQCYSIVSEWKDSVLLETSRPDHENQHSYLFVNPVRVLQVQTLSEIPGLLRQIEDCLREGLFVAGFMSYECGYHFEPSTATHVPKGSKVPLAWFGVYSQPFVFDHRSGTFEPELPQGWRKLAAPAIGTGNSPVSGCRLEMSREEYCAKVEAVRKYIAAGDTYQVNLTTKILFEYSAPPAALLSALRTQQRVSYAAYIHLGERHLLSFSPELFFRIKDGRITTRPMKGTAPRGRNLAEDVRLRDWLQTDSKNRSENVMIVDLLRNDLGKIAEIGSIRTDELFAVEKYETLFQMTSTVSATLRSGETLGDTFRAIFPSGSVTGAPKCRTMQIIQELERGPRGLYTGAIGYFSPSNETVFNVSIRTMVLEAGRGEMGVGSGIVFDSLPEQEYEECLLKTQFLTGLQPLFQLIESLRWDGTYHFLWQHLERLKSSAEYFAFAFCEDQAIAALEQNEKGLQSGKVYKVRLLLDPTGEISLDNVPLDPAPPSGTITVASIRTSSQDRFLYHKTTRRDLYQRLHSEAGRYGHEDVIFVNEKGEITEGAINNIFVKIGGMLFTPPVECGLLAGVFRQHVLESDHRAAERIVFLEDLRTAEAIYLCNSVRGLRQVSLAKEAIKKQRRKNPVASRG